MHTLVGNSLYTLNMVMHNLRNGWTSSLDGAVLKTNGVSLVLSAFVVCFALVVINSRSRLGVSKATNWFSSVLFTNFANAGRSPATAHQWHAKILCCQRCRVQRNWQFQYQPWPAKIIWLGARDFVFTVCGSERFLASIFLHKRTNVVAQVLWPYWISCSLHGKKAATKTNRTMFGKCHILHRLVTLHRLFICFSHITYTNSENISLQSVMWFFISTHCRYFDAVCQNKIASLWEILHGLWVCGVFSK